MGIFPWFLDGWTSVACFEPLRTWSNFDGPSTSSAIRLNWSLRLQASSVVIQYSILTAGFTPMQLSMVHSIIIMHGTSHGDVSRSFHQAPGAFSISCILIITKLRTFFSPGRRRIPYFVEITSRLRSPVSLRIHVRLGTSFNLGSRRRLLLQPRRGVTLTHL